LIFSVSKNRDGFTLVELIASLVLAGILAIALTTIIITATDGFFLSKDAAEISQKAQLALARIRTELVNASNISTADGNNIIFENEYGTQTIVLSGSTITLNSYTLTDGIEADYYTSANKFLIYEKTGSVAWVKPSDGSISELFAITITLKYSNYNNVFQTTINPRSNTLRNAPKLVYLDSGFRLATGRDSSGLTACCKT
jgi:prepilin-type N-terminal cleavage/methylation domain-containing protein